jgi:UDP-N-acetylglucosamine 2-epimerase (non-hydrolysing)
LIEENIWDEINITGYTVIDAIYMYFDKLKEAKEHLRSKYDQYALVTFHRAKNIDNPPKPYATL